MNKVFLMGNLGKDPEVKVLGSGKTVTKFSVATKFKEDVCWHNVVTWEKLAENCGEYLKKGSKVLVEGRIDNRSYDKDDGSKGYASDVVAVNVQFLSPKPSDGDDSAPF